jgi:hypothetical protein
MLLDKETTRIIPVACTIRTVDTPSPAMASIAPIRTAEQISNIIHDTLLEASIWKPGRHKTPSVVMKVTGHAPDRVDDGHHLILSAPPVRAKHLRLP